MSLDFTDIPDAHHFVACILGKASTEERAIHRWPQWRRVFEVLDPLFSRFAFRRVKSLQSRERVLRVNDDGTRRVSFDDLPTGGERKWSLESNEDIATRHLEAGAGNVTVVSTMIWAGPTRKGTAAGWDVWVDVKDATRTPDAVYDQSLYLFLSAVARSLLGAPLVERVLLDLHDVAHGVALATTHRPWTHASLEPGGATRLDVLIDRGFRQAGTLALRENPWAEWRVMVPA